MTAFDQSDTPRNGTFAILLLILLWLITRGILFAYYEPVTYGDSGTYQRLAQQIMTMNFSDYDGQRTPGYPLVIALVADNNYLLWLVQSIMALMTACLIYVLMKRAGVSTAWALLAAVINLLTLNSVFFEAAVMSETFTALLVVVVSYLMAVIVTGRANVRSPLWLGLATALLILTRSQYIVLIPIFVLLLWFFVRQSRTRTVLIFFVVALGPVLGWAEFNRQRIGYFTITSLLGFNLSNHSGGFMERAPDDVAVFRDIYLSYREGQIASTGSHNMTIYQAREELRRTSGLSDIELSKAFQRLSLRLFIAYPTNYLLSVSNAWLSYWTEPNYWRLDKIKDAGVASALQSVWKVQHPLLRGLNVVFIFLSLYIAWHLILFMRKDKMSDRLRVALVLSGNVIAVSLMQALVEFGENGRYFIPNQPLVLMCVLLVLADQSSRANKTLNSVRERDNLIR